MKKIKLLAVVVLAAFLGGCATLAPVGMLYTKVNVPMQMGDGKDITYSKVGQASANSYFSLIATGDASVDAAAKNGNIKTIKYVDYHVENILGVIGTYTTTVYGD
ncbi:MAG: TRL-like family protein [Candidatus Omnitrophica bacterium]|nr:TRL-like family protein [Candidatus Omnitrophota bacterium]